MRKDILIVGGGVIGLCTAYYAAERGHRVTVCDRAAATDLGCSYGNARMITPSHFVPLAAPCATAMEPSLRRTCAGGIYFPTDAHLAPSRFMAALIDRLRDRGVELQWNTEARLRVSRQRVESDRKADEYVICGGAWSSNIARDLQLHLPMQAGKGPSPSLAKPKRKAVAP